MRNNPRDILNLRPKSMREKLLLAVAANENKYVPATTLAKKLYGNSRRTAPLHMVALGLSSRLRFDRTGYQLKQHKEEGRVLYGLFRR